MKYASLLRRAAHVAGIALHGDYTCFHGVHGKNRGFKIDNARGETVLWEPLLYDDDALALAMAVPDLDLQMLAANAWQAEPVSLLGRLGSLRLRIVEAIAERAPLSVIDPEGVA